MTIEAFRYALQQAPVPAGRALWLYGDKRVATGDIYHPGLEIPGDSYDAVFINAPQQLEEVEGLIAFALRKSTGFVMAVAPNDAGGKRLAGLVEAYGVSVATLSKDRCRIVWTTQARQADQKMIEKNLAHLIPHPVLLDGETWWSVAGLFGWDKIDAGSRMLLEHLPPDLSGVAADFGCGYGYLSTLLARRYPEIKTIDAYDLDARAVECCAKNAGAKVKAIRQDIHTMTTAPRYNVIVMNPPFHSGKDEDVALGRIFLQKAWESLAAGGRLFLVANRHLPYEKVIPALTVAYEGQAYKIMTGQK